MISLAATLIIGLSNSLQEGVADEAIREARAALDRITEDEAEELSEQLRMESSWRKDFRAGLQAYLLANPPRDPGTWPMVTEPSIYDPKEHCPAQPIPRRRLQPDDPRTIKALEKFKPTEGGPHFKPGWTYDYASRELRRMADWDSPKRRLSNALLGSPPDQDLAIAFLEMHLDSGDLQSTFESFSHAYAERNGIVFPGITLYDAWASGAQMEMPDVECLGIVHDLMDDWKTWKAPVRKQDSLYDTIGELFFPARQHRGLRHSLAVAYLTGRSSALGDYSSNQVELHALWEHCASTPQKMAEKLPDSKGWRMFLEDWREQVRKDSALQRKAQTRIAALERSAQATRELVIRIFRENGFLAE